MLRLGVSTTELIIGCISFHFALETVIDFLFSSHIGKSPTLFNSQVELYRDLFRLLVIRRVDRGCEYYIKFKVFIQALALVSAVFQSEP